MQENETGQHPLQEVAMAYNYLLSYLLLHVAAFHGDPQADGQSSFLQYLKRDIGLTSLSDEAKSWALQVVSCAEMNWQVAADIAKERKSQ